MLIGKPAFDAEDMDDLVTKVEEGNYSIPTSMSREVVSFLNGMLQYDGKRRLTAAQLSRHDFLNKDIKTFHSIDLQKVSKKVDDEGLNVNVKSNATIWSIFNADSESLLTSITGNKFIQPLDEKEKIELEKLNEFGDTIKESFVRLPPKGIIPNNPGDSKITENKGKESSGYVIDFSIFDES